MQPVVVSDILAVGEFPTSDQLAILAKAGFKAIVNNQPDGEVARFESAASLEAEAHRLGLAYAYAPLSSRTPPPDELAVYAAALASLPSPIYAFCYSGARSAAGCALLLTDGMEVDAILRDFATSGFDLSGLRPWLEDERARRTGKTAGDKPDALDAEANGAAAHEGIAATVAAPLKTAVEPPIVPRPDRAAVAARQIVVQPRAAGYGGFAR